MADTFAYGTGLEESAITRGRSGHEKVTVVATHRFAFQTPKDAIPVLVYGAKSVSFLTKKVMEIQARHAADSHRGCVRCGV